MDQVNFHGKPETYSKFHRFEGNIEEQATILHSKHKKREINQSQQPDWDEKITEE